MKKAYHFTSLFSRRPLVLAIAVTLNACANQPIGIEPLYQSQFCNNISRDLTLGGIELIDQDKLLTVISQPSTVTSGMPSVKGKGYTLLITPGLKSSAGYAVALNSREAIIEQATLKLPISFKQPPSGAITASVMTSPCLVVDVPKGRYTAVQAGDYFLQLP